MRRAYRRVHANWVRNCEGSYGQLLLRSCFRALKVYWASCPARAADTPEQQASGVSPTVDIPFLDNEFVHNGYYVAKHTTGVFAVLTPGEYHNLRVKAYRQKSYAHDCVYISGPMTGYANANIPAFIKSELAHLALGHTVFSPAHNQKTSGMTWEDYMRLAIPQLMQCKTIHMLRKWEKSRGALIEHNLACAVGMDVTYE